MFIGFEVRLLLINQFKAVIFSALDNEQLVSRFSLFDDLCAIDELPLRHHFDQSLFIFPVKVLEKDGVSNQGFNEHLGLLTLGDF